MKVNPLLLSNESQDLESCHPGKKISWVGQRELKSYMSENTKMV
jgi:hypothetical protein